MNKAKLLLGDVRERLAELPDQSVQCVVTSPPYWGLRDYGHDGQIGLEQSPEKYVAEMVAVFREVRRVLKDDGVLWLNLGDSYGKDKQLVGIPWRVAFALQADGWWLRQDIIWHKPNPMPEPAPGRCTKAHEYLFLLAKQMKYSYDNDAIREEPKLTAQTALDQTPVEMNEKDIERMQMAKKVWGGNQMSKPRGAMYRGFKELKGANKKSVWTIPTKGFRGAHFAVMPEALCEPPILATSKPGDLVLDPFTGSGTVAVVALRHGRDFVGCELNPEYAKIAEDRISGDQPMMNQVEIETSSSK